MAKPLVNPCTNGFNCPAQYGSQGDPSKRITKPLEVALKLTKHDLKHLNFVTRPTSQPGTTHEPMHPKGYEDASDVSPIHWMEALGL